MTQTPQHKVARHHKLLTSAQRVFDQAEEGASLLRLEEDLGWPVVPINLLDEINRYTPRQAHVCDHAFLMSVTCVRMRLIGLRCHTHIACLVILQHIFVHDMSCKQKAKVLVHGRSPRRSVSDMKTGDEGAAQISKALTKTRTHMRRDISMHKLLWGSASRIPKSIRTWQKMQAAGVNPDRQAAAIHACICLYMYARCWCGRRKAPTYVTICWMCIHVSVCTRIHGQRRTACHPHKYMDVDKDMPVDEPCILVSKAQVLTHTHDTRRRLEHVALDWMRDISVMLSHFTQDLLAYKMATDLQVPCVYIKASKNMDISMPRLNKTYVSRCPG
jgi:hypothetical protein